MTTQMNSRQVELAWTLAQVHGSVHAGISLALKRHGLTHSMLQAMIQLRQSPGRRLRMADLADDLAFTRSGITRLVDRLVAFGLVIRTACVDDRRALWAELTEEGERALALALPGYLAALDTLVIDRLSPEQLDRVMSSLAVLHEALAGFEPAVGGDISGP